MKINLEEKIMGVLEYVLGIAILVMAVFLALAVLMQSGKDSRLSGAIAGNSESYMTKSKNGGLDKKMAAATKWVVLAWIVLTLVISLLP